MFVPTSWSEIMHLLQHSRYTYTVRHVSVTATTIIGEGNTTYHTNTAVRRCLSAHAHTAIWRVRLQHRAVCHTATYVLLWPAVQSGLDFPLGGACCEGTMSPRGQRNLSVDSCVCTPKWDLETQRDLFLKLSKYYMSDFLIIIFIDCKWVDTRWQWSFNMLHMHGLWRLII